MPAASIRTNWPLTVAQQPSPLTAARESGPPLKLVVERTSRDPSPLSCRWCTAWLHLSITQQVPFEGSTETPVALYSVSEAKTVVERSGFSRRCETFPVEQSAIQTVPSFGSTLIERMLLKEVVERIDPSASR